MYTVTFAKRTALSIIDKLCYLAKFCSSLGHICRRNLYVKPVLLMLGGRVGLVVRALAFHNVAWVRFPHSVSYVD